MMGCSVLAVFLGIKPFRGGHFYEGNCRDYADWVKAKSIEMKLAPGCYRPAINTFIEARKQKIDELNTTHGLGPGHNRAKARTHPNAIPELVKRFKEEVLGF